MHVMHFQNAVREHNEWWVQFEQYLKSNADEHTFKDVVRDDCCAIGQWLHGDGQEFSHLDEFQTVMKHHKDLHNAAGSAREAKLQGDAIAVQDAIDELLKLRHLLFMSWNTLNDIIGGLN